MGAERVKDSKIQTLKTEWLMQTQAPSTSATTFCKEKVLTNCVT